MELSSLKKHISNHFVMKGLARYGYEAEAKALARATVELLRRDYAENASFHEYYDPEDGTGVFHKGFTSWNALAANILAYLEGRTPVEEWMCLNL